MNILAVRLKTSYWNDKRGGYIKKSITFLKKQSSGFNLLEEDFKDVGADETLRRIINLDQCNDGIYNVFMCNIQHDSETGCIDYYDYELVAI